MLRFFNVYIPTNVVVLLVSEAALLFGCYSLAALLRLDIDVEVFLLYDGGLAAISTVVATIVLANYFQDLYGSLRVRSHTLLFQQTCFALGIAFLVQAVLNYLNPSWELPRWVMFIGSGIALIAVPLWRMTFSAMVTNPGALQKVLFIGTSKIVQELADEFDRAPEKGFACAGFIREREFSPDGEDDPRVVGRLPYIKEAVEKVKPDRIAVGLAERRLQLPVDDLLQLRFSGIPIQQAGALYEATFGRVTIRELRPSDLIFTAGLGPNQSSVQLQTIYSFIIAVILLVVFAPVMLVVAILVKLTSKGPVFYRQVRVGKDDTHFTLSKFRSMRVDAEALTGAVWATKDDPRVTPLGKWLRKLRLDELPQLWNVLAGEMSIVGPRPERPEFTRTLQEKIPFYRQRTCVKPGVTGWAQINHKYGDTLEDTIRKLEYDLYYIKHLSFSLDLYIVLSTIKTVLLGRGAQ
jgi:sugar transferase (PEP-CTERM system associated)